MTTDQSDADKNEAIARCIEQYTQLFRDQVQREGGWPAKFRFPEPTNDTEREALRLFLAEVETTTGVRVKVTASG